VKFVGTVVYLKRQDHDDDDANAPKAVTDVRLDGKVDGHPVWIELAIPTRLAGSYCIGRRIIVTVRPA